MTESKLSLLPKIIEAQRSSIVANGRLLSYPELTRMFGVSKKWLHKRLPMEYRLPSHGMEKDENKVLRKKIIEIQTERISKFGVPYTITELAGLLDIRVARMEHLFKHLPKKYKVPSSQAKPYLSSTKLDNDMSKAVSDVSGALRSIPRGNRLREDVAQSLLLRLITEQVKQHPVHCPKHPNSHLVWSCGDSLVEVT